MTQLRRNLPVGGTGGLESNSARDDRHPQLWHAVSRLAKRHPAALAAILRQAPLEPANARLGRQEDPRRPVWDLPNAS